jgi:hypothetical protein
MSLFDSFPKKMGTTFFVIALLLPALYYVIPSVDTSCGDGSCMVEGLMFRYVLYAAIVLSYYASTIYFLRIKLRSYWQCALLAIPTLLLVSPRGVFNNFF